MAHNCATQARFLVCYNPSYQMRIIYTAKLCEQQAPLRGRERGPGARWRAPGICDDAWCSPASPGEALVEAESRHEAAVLVDREARQDGLPARRAMEGAVVAAEAVPQRDDAQRADLVTARAWENHRRPLLNVERLGADGTLEVQLQIGLATDDCLVLMGQYVLVEVSQQQALASTVFATRRSVCGCGRYH